MENHLPEYKVETNLKNVNLERLFDKVKPIKQLYLGRACRIPQQKLQLDYALRHFCNLGYIFDFENVHENLFEKKMKITKLALNLVHVNDVILRNDFLDYVIESCHFSSDNLWKAKIIDENSIDIFLQYEQRSHHSKNLKNMRSQFCGLLENVIFSVKN